MLLGGVRRRQESFLGSFMVFLESFLDALGRSGLLPDASGTLLDDKGGLTRYVCSGLKVWKGSNTTLVMDLALPGQVTTASNPHSGWRRRALRSSNF